MAYLRSLNVKLLHKKLHRLINRWNAVERWVRGPASSHSKVPDLEVELVSLKGAGKCIDPFLSTGGDWKLPETAGGSQEAPSRVHSREQGDKSDTQRGPKSLLCLEAMHRARHHPQPFSKKWDGQAEMAVKMLLATLPKAYLPWISLLCFLGVFFKNKNR